MKKYIINTLLFSLVLLISVTCSDNEKENGYKISIQPTSLDFEKEGGTKLFSITPNKEANVQSSENWCYVSLFTNSYDRIEYKVVLTPNPTTKIRTAMITIEVEDFKGEVKVEQAAGDTDKPEPAPDIYTVRENLTTQQLVDEMGLGINLGNTLDAVGDWIDPSNILNYEQAWGSPIITQEIIKGYANAGYKSMRIPVSWDNLMGENGEIHPDLMNRVETILNWVLDCGMVAIVNIHHDNEWVKLVPTDLKAKEKYIYLWQQICGCLEKYGDHLIFEPMNEIGYDEIWTPWSGGESAKAKAFGYINDINQIFVDAVRACGGNNAKRHLMVETYNTGLEYAFDPLFKIPNDPANRIAVTVHYYTPATYAILGGGEDAGWGVGQETWGTDEEKKELKKNMDLLKTNCVDKGIPIIVGEYGASTSGRTQENVRFYLVSVTEAIYSRGMCPMLWDTPGGQYNRQTCQFDDPLFLEEMMAIPAKYPRY